MREPEARLGAMLKKQSMQCGEPFREGSGSEREGQTVLAVSFERQI